MLYTILIFRDFIFKENALFTYFIVLFLYKTVKTAESILNSDDIVYPFFIFRLFVFVLPKCVFFVFCIVLCTEHNSCNINYFRCCGLPTIPRLSTKYPTNIPQNVHIQPRNTWRTIRKAQGSIHCARIFTLLNMHIRFLVHVCPHYQIRIFIPPHTYICFSFCGFFGICGCDKSVPYGCLRSAKMLLMGWNFAVVYVSANTIKLCLHIHLQLAITQ